jgi:hypothetical protein
MKNLVVTIFLFVNFNLSSFACDINGTTGIFPNNNMNIPTGLKSYSGLLSTRGLSQQRFNIVLDKVEKIYTNEFTKRGKKFILNRLWSNGQVNSYAHQEGDTWNIDMYGGLARYPQMTEDGYALVACHEIGHHLGGAPHSIDKTRSWGANEGQADYFANLKCMRKLFENDNNQQVVSKMPIPNEVKEKCSLVYKNANEYAICIRSSLAGLVLGKIMNELSQDGNVDFTTPDPSVVAVTFDGHPKSQCRLDTYFQASLCDKSISDDLSDNDYRVGTCTKSSGDEIGIRPTCWFNEI